MVFFLSSHHHTEEELGEHKEIFESYDLNKVNIS